MAQSTDFYHYFRENLLVLIAPEKPQDKTVDKIQAPYPDKKRLDLKNSQSPRMAREVQGVLEEK